jgi:DNA repair protein RadC
MKVEEAVSFKRWMPGDKPREKAKTKGLRSLSKPELLAIVLKTGTVRCNCLEISRRALAAAGNSFDTLGEMPLSALQEIHGIGEAQAIVIAAAMEMRRRTEIPVDSPKIISSRDAFAQLQDDLSYLSHEEFWVLYLNRASKMILKKQISSGGTHSTVVDPRIVFSPILDKTTTSSIILAHNHPSGGLSPSQADIDLTNKLISAGKLFDVQVVDHLILAGKNYCSFADSGLL